MVNIYTLLLNVYRSDVEQGILIKRFHNRRILLKKLTAENCEMLITQRLLQTRILN